jgi:predicted PurR-regulated permease PerM
MKDRIILQLSGIAVILFIFFYSLLLARDFLIPLVIAGLFALLLKPLNNFLVRKGWNGILAAVVCLLIIFVVVSAIVTLFSSQVMNLAEDMPLIKAKATEKFQTIQSTIEEVTRVSPKQQMAYFNQQYKSFMDQSGGMIGKFIMGFTGFLAGFGIIMVYTLFFLLYKGKIKKFILKLFPEDNHEKIQMIINRIQSLVQHYLVGILIELSVLGMMNSIGLLILGIKTPFFFGYLAALLNIIPYVGVLIGSLFPIVMALIFKDSMWSAIAVAGVMSFNQFVDNNFLTPKIVGSHVRINPLATIIAIVAGGLLWGIAGMILFIPLLGILKIICDHIDPLRPFGFLLGDEINPKKSKPKLIIASGVNTPK